MNLLFWEERDNPKLEPHPHMKAWSEKSKPQLNTRDFHVSMDREEKIQ